MKFLAIIFVMFSASCTTPGKITDIIVSPSLLNTTFDNGVEVSDATVVTEGETTYLYRKGKSPEGNCIVSRTPLIDANGQYMMRINGLTETCTGKNCSYCAFKTTGGCECKNSLNLCEHTISRNRDILKLP